MKRLFNAVVFATLLSLPALAQDDDGEWIQIFNGKDLDDWTPKFAGVQVGENYLNTFRVEDGMLRVVYDDWEEWGGKFGHLFYKTPYSNYRIRVEYRFTGEQVPGAPAWAWRNNGLKLHSQSPESMAFDQASPVSTEVQLLGGNGTDERSTANMCSKGTHVVIDGKLIIPHCYNSSSETYHGDQWVTVEVELRGSKVFNHYVNGDLVLSYSDLQMDMREEISRRLVNGFDNLLISGGYIGIQAESHPTDFRKIEILPLEE